MKTIPGMKPLVNASGEEVQCIPEMVIESVNQTDVDLHKELLSGVILTGAVHKSTSCKRRGLAATMEFAGNKSKMHRLLMCREWYFTDVFTFQSMCPCIACRLELYITARSS